MTPLARVTLRAALAALLAVPALAPPVARAQICIAPDGVTASNGTNCSNVVVSWSGGNRGDSFTVFRATTDPIVANATIIGGTSSTTFTDSQALAGVTYWYWVRKTNSSCPNGSSLAGPDAGFIGTMPAPTGFTASDATSCAHVHLSWDPIPNVGFTEVWRSTTANLNTATIQVLVGGSFFDDTSAIPGVEYFYWIRGTRGSCLGAFQAALESGTRKKAVLPDLVPVTTPFLGTPQVIVFADSHAELFFESIVANVGTGAFDFEPKKAFPDGTFEFGQDWVDACGSGRLQVNALGRAKPPTAQNPATFPHFLRVTLRDRAPGDVPGDSRAILDLPSSCVRDVDHYFSLLPESPVAPKYTSCTSATHGISVGWGTKIALGDNGQRLHLRCVPNGDYFLEFTADPDDVVEELDETNNTALVPVSLLNLPASGPPPCPFPAIDARLLGPDSIAVVAGAPSDTFKVRVWMAGWSEAPGPPAIPHVQLGFALRDAFARAAQGTDPWTWVPATWLRQDGPFDVWGGQPVVPIPGEYFVTFRVADDDGHFVIPDLGGTNDGLQFDELSLLSARSTTGVGDGAASAALEFAVVSNPARHATRFSVSLPEETTMAIGIFDVRGRRVRTIEPGLLATGPHVIEWDGRDDDGITAPAGVFFARLETPHGASARVKWVLAR